jgi:hypothetical protein
MDEDTILSIRVYTKESYSTYIILLPVDPVEVFGAIMNLLGDPENSIT